LFLFFCDRVLLTLQELASDLNPLTSAPLVAGIIGMYHHTTMLLIFMQ
jgi:hypothetical protein